MQTDLKRICVLIPIYKDKFTSDEEYAVDRITNVLSQRRIYFVSPHQIRKSYYEKRYTSVEYAGFDNSYFFSTKTYNKLMMNTEFYARFIDYEYVAIIQPDVMLLDSEDRLDEFLDLGWDYVGGVFAEKQKICRWDVPGKRVLMNVLPSIVSKCGNGGFSIRKIKTTIALLNKHRFTVRFWGYAYNEDTFFTYFAYNPKYKSFNGMPEKDVWNYSFDFGMKDEILKGNIPYAYHAWHRDFRLEEIIQYFTE